MCQETTGLSQQCVSEKGAMCFLFIGIFTIRAHKRTMYIFLTYSPAIVRIGSVVIQLRIAIGVIGILWIVVEIL